MPVILCRNLTKVFGKTPALDKLDLTVDEGTIYGFLGPNGAGKTTTLKILTGLSQPTSGQAWVDGIEVQPNSRHLQSRIGYLPEEPSFYTWMSAREYMKFVGRIFNLSPGENDRRCDQLLELVNLEEAAGRRIAGFSRGMRQRLGIAQALINRPKVLFLDEPSSALDPFGRAEILETLNRLKAEATTVFLSSHILADVERVCDIVGIIDQGRLVIEASVDELRRRFARSVFVVEFEETAPAFAPLLDALPWIERVHTEMGTEGARFSIRVKDMVTAKQELPRVVAASGFTLRRYETEMPTLEDAFLQLLGRKDSNA